MDKLIVTLREYADWTEQNGYYVPLGLTDALLEAAARLEMADGRTDAAAKVAKHYKDQRDAAVAQLRKLGDCSTCRKDKPVGMDGPECVACTRGQAWEWDGGKSPRE